MSKTAQRVWPAWPKTKIDITVEVQSLVLDIAKVFRHNIHSCF